MSHLLLYFSKIALFIGDDQFWFIFEFLLIFFFLSPISTWNISLPLIRHSIRIEFFLLFWTFITQTFSFLRNRIDFVLMIIVMFSEVMLLNSYLIRLKLFPEILIFIGFFSPFEMNIWFLFFYRFLKFLIQVWLLTVVCTLLYYI